ncbi:Nuclear hormone receptor family member nhr-28 [Aphelenchoides fujianensis]|nr:Nuclear hormone receptor family member nhr-28 [Aphelenchoides fujianensis]
MAGSTTETADGDVLKCSICGENADGSHFGANACRACAAFFRRTVAKNLKYVCRFNNACVISQSYRCMCRSCRLKKCLAMASTKRGKNAVPAEPVHKPATCKLKSPQSAGSAASTSSQPPPESPTTSIAERLKTLQAIINASRKTIIVDPNSLAPSFPTLSRMLIAYEELQRIRDAVFSRSADGAGVATGHKNFRGTGSQDELVRAADKLLLFKEFWIHFTILERAFDTYRVLGTDLTDPRLVFSDGSVVDVTVADRVKIDGVADCNDAEKASLLNALRPWFRMCSEVISPAVKQLQPTAVEMIFCFGMMLYGCEDHLHPLYSDSRTSELSDSTLQFMRYMTSTLYNELNEYYRLDYPVSNVVERVGELMRFITKTERIVTYRKEDILFTRVFGVFKADIYLEQIFNEQ